MRHVVHVFEVGPHQSPQLTELWDYLPAILVAGILATGCIYFSATAASDSRDRGAFLIALIAASTMLQLLVEVSRAFITYAYPWHLARIAAVACLAAMTACLIAAYAAHRFVPAWRRPLRLTVAAAATVSILLVPTYDLKALGAVLSGATGLAICAGYAVRHRRNDGWAGIMAALSFVVLIAWQRDDFLNQAYYMLLAGLLLVLVAEQVGSLRRLRAERDAETVRAAGLSERLSRAEQEGEPIVALKNGSRVYRVPECDIVFIQAADDYCEVTLGDSRLLLVTMSLARFLATLSPRFVRVHKSFAVNRAHVTGASPRFGGGRQLTLSNCSAIPVGRSYSSAVASLIC